MFMIHDFTASRRRTKRPLAPIDFVFVRKEVCEAFINQSTVKNRFDIQKTLVKEEKYKK